MYLNICPYANAHVEGSDNRKHYAPVMTYLIAFFNNDRNAPRCSKTYFLLRSFPPLLP